MDALIMTEALTHISLWMRQALPAISVGLETIGTGWHHLNTGNKVIRQPRISAGLGFVDQEEPF